MMRAMIVLLLGTSLALVIGCGEKKAPPAQAPQQSAADPAQQEKDGYAAAVQKELDEIKLGIEALKADAKAPGVEDKAKLDQQVDVLERKWQVAEKQFDELKSANAQAWRDLRAGMDAALADLRQAFSKTQQPA
jgi:hypothetical protein